MLKAVCKRGTVRQHAGHEQRGIASPNLRARGAKGDDLKANGAFTFIELLVIIATIAILAAVFMPVLIKERAKAAESQCIGNLKQVGLGFSVWVYDSVRGAFPFRTEVSDRGNMAPMGTGGASPFSNPSLERNKAYWQFAFISNELRNPRVLVCPSDQGVGARRKCAKTFDSKPGGLMAADYRDQACSLTVALEGWISMSGPPTLERYTSQILSTDRNIRWDGHNANCSSGVGDAQQIIGRDVWMRGQPASAPWTNSIHISRGNVLTANGAVESCNTTQLDVLADNARDNGSVHFLVPN
jgi:type II secretory pathway pseudopilin PulG